MRIKVFALLSLCLVSAASTLTELQPALKIGNTRRIGLSKSSRSSAEAAKPSKARIVESYGKLPLSFEANQGQTDSEVKFVSRGGGYSLFLTSTEAVLELQKPGVRSQKPEAGKNPQITQISPIALQSAQSVKSVDDAVLRMKLVGANPTPQVTGLDELPGKSNYFIGNDPKTWRTNVPNYAKVKYSDVYPGIDLVYYGNQQQLEYDFVVAPGANPEAIRLSFDGAEKISTTPKGDLVVHVKGDEVRLRKPVVYQEVDGRRRAVRGGYVLEAGDRQGFKLAAYDPTKALVIDPMLVFTTAIVGANARAFVLDNTGNAYIAGDANGFGFPTTPGTVAASGSGIFVTKVNMSGPSLVYSTHLSPPPSGSVVSVASTGFAIAIDSSGDAYVTGTARTGFPTTAGAFQTAIPGNGSSNSAAIVVKLSPDGSKLLYSTYIGTQGSGQGIAVDLAGSAYVAGYTTSSDFPAFSPIQSTFGGGTCNFNQTCPDAFVAKLTPDGSGLLYSTFLGGPSGDEANAIAVDSAGSAYVTGYAGNNFPTTPGAFQTSLPQGGAFVSKLNPTGTSLVYSTYLGGPSNGDMSPSAFGNAIAIDAAGYAYVAGTTSAADFPTVNAFQSRVNGQDAFVSKLDPTGSYLTYSTFFGGSGSEYGNAIAVDLSGNAYVAGATTGCSLPVVNPLLSQASLPGLSAGFACGQSGISALSPFVAEFSAFGNSLLFSTFLPGDTNVNSFNNWLNAVAVDSGGNIYVAGYIQLRDYPLIPGPFGTPSQSTPVGGLFAEITLSANPAPQVTSLSPSSITSGPSGFNLTVTGSGFFAGSVVYWNSSPRPTTVTGLGTLVAAISAQDIAAGGTAFVTVYNPTPGGGTSIALAFTINGVPSPTILSLQPPSAAVGGPAFTLTVTGTSFLSGSIVQWNGNNRATTYLSSTQLTIFVVPADIASPGTAQVTVVNPPGGGGTSKAVTFTIGAGGLNPTPVLGTLSPSTTAAGGPVFTLTVNGSNFVAGATVLWNGNARSTSFESATQLTALINASDIATAGTAQVTVLNPAPGGGTSNALPFIVVVSSPCTYSLSPNGASYLSSAGTGGFQVLTAAGCDWTAASSSDWIILTSASGSGNGAVFYSFAANTAASARTGSISVAGQIFTVTQAGAAPPSGTTSFEPTLTVQLNPGFYIAEATLAPGALGGAWGLQVLTSLGLSPGGFDLGGGVPSGTANPGFGAFLLSTAQTVTATLNAQGSPGAQFTLRFLDSNRQLVGSPVSGAAPLTLTSSLAPGFYIVEVYNSAAVPFNFQLGLAAGSFSGGMDTGGYLGEGNVGFGAFYVPIAQTVQIQAFGRSTYGAIGAGDLILTLRDANRNVIQVVSP